MHKWRQIACWSTLALAGPGLVAITLRLATTAIPETVSPLLPVFAMPAPLLAAIYMRRRSGGPSVAESLRGALRSPLMTVVLPIVAVTMWLATALTAAALTGTLLTTPADLRSQLHKIAPTATAHELPSVAILLAVTVGAGLVAGFTLNGVVAFGEEHGWRGYLWTQLADQRPAFRIATTGVLWGLWHAPLITLVGLNYPDDRVIGVASMVLLTTCLAWPMDELRRASGSAVAPAILHGSFNAVGGLLLLLCSGTRTVAPPLGMPERSPGSPPASPSAPSTSVNNMTPRRR